MTALRPDQEALLASHRARAAGRLETVVAGTPLGDPQRSPEGQALLKEEPEVLVSVAVCVVAAHCEAELENQKVIWVTGRSAVPTMLLRVLRRRRLPWTPADAELLLDLGADASLVDLEFAVAVAQRVLVRHPGDPGVYSALEASGPAIEAMGQGARVGGIRQKIRTLIAENAPGGLLDLTVLQDGDRWAPLAATAAREHARRWDGTQALLAQLAAARGTRPSQRWIARTRDLLEPAEAPSLVRALLEPVLSLDPEPGKPLLAPANERIVCGAAWALGLVPSEESVALLQDVALACAGPARVAARAAVEGLVLVGTPASTEALRGLLADMSRVTIRERIAEVVETTTTPRRRSADAVRAFGGAVLDALAAHGFTDRKGRESWRFSPDRVEAVWMRSHQGAPLVDVGVAHAAAHRGALGRFKVYFCDLRGMARLDDGVDVDAALAQTLAWFDRWQDPAAVVDFVLSEIGLAEVEGFETHGPRGLDTGAGNLLVGYLAARAGRPELVQPCLEWAADHYRGLLELTDPRDEDLAAFVDRLEADAAAV